MDAILQMTLSILIFSWKLYFYSNFIEIWYDKSTGNTVCKENDIATLSLDDRLTYWGRVTHICISKLTIIGSDNGLSPSWRQAIISTSAGILLIRPLGTNFSEILIGIQTFS